MTAQTTAEAFAAINEGDSFQGEPFKPTRETIKRFAEASLDFNPLHFDDNYMANNFGKTNFGGVIMHGMQNFALITRTLTDWLMPRGGYHRRLETRWLKPVRPRRRDHARRWWSAKSRSPPGAAGSYSRSRSTTRTTNRSPRAGRWRSFPTSSRSPDAGAVQPTTTEAVNSAAILRKRIPEEEH